MPRNATGERDQIGEFTAIVQREYDHWLNAQDSATDLFDPRPDEAIEVTKA
jgi:hypothetical protein